MKRSDSPPTSSQPVIFLKKWHRFKQGCLFCLSNKVIQAVFNDKSELIVDKANNTLCYLPKEAGAEA